MFDDLVEFIVKIVELLYIFWLYLRKEEDIFIIGNYGIDVVDDDFDEE